ncbi:MAG: sensor histidine kinase [Microcystaceae cyanobacterium]
MDSVNYNELGQQILRIVQRFPDSQQVLLETARFLAVTFEVDTCILIVNARINGVIWSSQWVNDIEKKIKSKLMAEKWFNDLKNTQEPQIIVPSSSLLPDFPLHTGLAMTTRFRSDPNGMIFLGSQTARHWSSEEINGIHRLTDCLALTYHLTQDENEITPSSTELDRETEERVRRLFPNQGSPIVKQLYELMRQQLAQQRQLNEFKDNIITAISDKARNPLASMQMAITLLKADNLPSEQKHRYVGILEDEWQQLNVLINNIVILKQLETNELQVSRQPLSIMPLIEQIAVPLREKWAKDRRKFPILSLNPLQIPQTFYSDPRHLRTILVELLTNGGIYADPDTTVKVTINSNHSEAGETLMIQIENQGSQIEADEIEKVFDLFYRGRDALDRSIPGTGIGLALVKGLVELLEGDIQLVSQPQEENDSASTTVTLTFPSLPPTARE